MLMLIFMPIIPNTMRRSLDSALVAAIVARSIENILFDSDKGSPVEVYTRENYRKLLSENATALSVKIGLTEFLLQERIPTVLIMRILFSEPIDKQINKLMKEIDGQEKTITPDEIAAFLEEDMKDWLMKETDPEESDKNSPCGQCDISGKCNKALFRQFCGK